MKITDYDKVKTVESDDILLLDGENGTKIIRASDLALALEQYMEHSYDNYVPTTRKVNNKALSADISLTASDVGARASTWTPTASDVGARPSTWTPTAADVGAVPTTRKINNNALSADITLSAADVGARPSTWTPTAADVGARPSSWTPTASDVGAVPTTRKVNNKALSADISLTASDVGARPSTWIPTATDVGAAPANHGIHVTADEKTSWNNKATPSDITTAINNKIVISATQPAVLEGRIWIKL